MTKVKIITGNHDDPNALETKVNTWLNDDDNNKKNCKIYTTRVIQRNKFITIIYHYTTDKE